MTDESRITDSKITNPMAVNITAKAAAQVKKHLSKADKGTLGIRLFIRDGKGCGGSEYAMEYVSSAPPSHDRVERDGAIIFIPIQDSLRFFKMEIDYGADEIGNEKFIFNNPNEKGKCGCGESVSF